MTDEKTTVVKVHSIGRDGSEVSNTLIQNNTVEMNFDSDVVLQPPLDPEFLQELYRVSGPLRANIDVYVANIDGFGYGFEPTIDLNDPKLRDLIADSILEERITKAYLPASGTPPTRSLKHLMKAMGDAHEADSSTADTSAIAVSDADVNEAIEKLEYDMRIEEQILTTYFRYCCVESSFVDLRQTTRIDLEVTGNAYWEVLRNNTGDPTRFVFVPSTTVRLLPQDTKPTLVDAAIMRTPLRAGTESVNKRFRKYIQRVPETAKLVYFKEFGDLRVISSDTGKTFVDQEALARTEPAASPATEMLHFSIHASGSPYGIPRWASVLSEVQGVRDAAEINLDYFHNKGIPEMVFMISGGTLGDGQAEKLRSVLNNEIRGKKNYHKVLVIEAEPYKSSLTGQSSGSVRIEMKPLHQAISDDGLFMKYADASADTIGTAFRVPRLLRGDVRDFNRGCYDAHTQTLTARGWLHVDEITPGDYVAAHNPETQCTEWVVPEEILKFNVDESMLHFISDDCDILVTRDHKMLVRKAGDTGARYTAHEAQHIPWPSYELKIGVEETGSSEAENTDAYQAEMADALTLGFISRQLLDFPADTYTVEVTLDEENVDPTDFARVVDSLHRMEFTRDGSTYTLGDVGDEHPFSGRYIRTNGVVELHRLPRMGMEWDSVLAAEFIRGFEYVGTATFTARGVIDDLAALCVCVGSSPRVTMFVDNFGVEHWTIKTTNRFPRTAVLHNPPTLVPYQGMVHCLSVPSHGFYVTRRNGKVAVQGNTAEASVAFSEKQVFAPMRNRSDWEINHKILPAIGIKYFRFKSKGPISTDKVEMGTILNESAGQGYLTLKDYRQLAEEVFERQFESEVDINDISTTPLALLRLGIGGGDVIRPDDGKGPPSPPSPPSPVKDEPAEQAKHAQELIKLEKHFRALAEANANASLSAWKKHTGKDTK